MLTKKDKLIRALTVTGRIEGGTAVTIGEQIQGGAEFCYAECKLAIRPNEENRC